jgi:hypothetical protein
MALACKAVKGKPDKKLRLGASLVLLRGAMDVARMRVPKLV